MKRYIKNFSLLISLGLLALTLIYGGTLASLSSGNSVAPIAGFTGISNQVLLFGIHSGRFDGLSVFSPIDGI